MENFYNIFMPINIYITCQLVIIYTIHKGVINMKKNNLIVKGLTIAILILFFEASVVTGFNKVTDNEVSIPKFNQGYDRGDDFDWEVSGDDIFTVHGGSYPSGKVGIGTSSPSYKLDIRGSDSSPLLNIQKSGSGRGVRVYTSSACAFWVANSGNHGLRVTHADGDGIHVEEADGWAGYFNGKGYFADNVGIGTQSPDSPLEVRGIIESSSGGFKFPDGSIQITTINSSDYGNTLDQAYDQGGAGTGKTIIADSGAVNIDGPDGLIINGSVGINTKNPDYLLDVFGAMDIVARFSGRVKDVDAVEDDEYVTKKQVESISNFYYSPSYYTPTSTDDPNGNEGDTSWDSNYFYIKTSDGWKRAKLETWSSTSSLVR